MGTSVFPQQQTFAECLNWGDFKPLDFSVFEAEADITVDNIAVDIILCYCEAVTHQHS